MPKLREIDVDYEQIKGLACQLAFEKKLALIKELVTEKSYKESFYRYTESLIKKFFEQKGNNDGIYSFKNSA